MAAARLGDAPRARVRSARAAWNKASDRRQITAPPAMKASTLMNQDARPLQPTRSVEVPLVRRAVRVRSAASNVLDPYSVRRNVLATAREWNVVLSASAATAPLLATAWNVATTARAPSAPGSAKVTAAVPTAVARKEAKMRRLNRNKSLQSIQKACTSKVKNCKLDQIGWSIYRGSHIPHYGGNFHLI